MNKICTSIEQSKKLIELGIDVNTADMYYSSIPVREWKDKNDTAQGIHLVFKEKVFAIENTNDEIGEEDTPAWSLSALLSVLPNKLQIALAINDFQGDRKEKYAIGSVEHDKYDCFADNSVDACYEMIKKLHELKLL